MEEIVVGGSSANPPHLGHRMLIQRLLGLGRFSQVIWILCGKRLDKTIDVEPDHRVAMTNLTIPPSWTMRDKTLLRVIFRDVYAENRPTVEWLARLSRENPGAEVAWFTGADSVAPQDRYGGECEIRKTWAAGEILMKERRFYIVPREGYPNPRSLILPPQFEVLDISVPEMSSSDIRQRIGSGKPFEHFVTAGVANYVKRFGLYGWKGKER